MFSSTVASSAHSVSSRCGAPVLARQSPSVQGRAPCSPPSQTSNSWPLRRCRLHTAAKSRSAVTMAADEGNQATASPDEDEDDDDLTPFEAAMKRRNRPKKGGLGPKVVAPQVEQAYGDSPQSPASQTETAVLQFLGLFFAVIISEGVFLAASGFLPEAADRFATDVLYPAFSPQMAIFFTCSTAYGVWKTRTSQ